MPKLEGFRVKLVNFPGEKGRSGSLSSFDFRP